MLAFALLVSLAHAAPTSKAEEPLLRRGEPEVAIPAAPTQPPRWSNPPVAPAAPDAEGEPAPVAFGSLQVDAKVPAEVRMDGLPLGQLFVTGELEVAVASGKHEITILRGGRPETVTVEVHPNDPVVLVVGKTGTSIGAPALTLEPRATGPASLEVRVAGQGGMQLRIDGKRHELGPGQVLALQIPVGKHAISVRSADGTVIWANGDLDLAGPEAVLQLSEGAMPEITGDATFVAHGG